MSNIEIQALKAHLLKNIGLLQDELKAFPNENSLWETRGSISNSAGNLGLHIAGNLQHFIGHVLGNSGYIRNRPFEFEAKDLPLNAILTELDVSAEVVGKVLDLLTTEELSADFPIEFSHEKSSVYFNLLRFALHLTYHLGQVNYLRRCMDE